MNPRRAVLVLMVIATLALPSLSYAQQGLLAPRSACSGQLGVGNSLKVQRRAMRCLVNYTRSQHSLSALSTSSLLERSSISKAKDIIRCRDFSHYACGRPLTYWFQRVGYITCGCSWVIGENIAWAGASVWSGFESPRSIMRDWIHSPEHLRNILDPRWKEQGVAVILGPFEGQRRAAMWVNEFGVRY